MKKQKRLIIVLIIIFIASIIVLTVCFPIFQKPDNTTPYEKKITKHYSEKDILFLRRLFEDGRLTSSTAFLLLYRPQCVREIPYGDKYALLLGDDGTKVFVVLGKKRIANLIIENSFLENKNFESVDIGKTTFEEMLEFDNNSVNLSREVEPATGHITQEGVVVIKYELPNLIVKSIDYYSNEEIINMLQDHPLLVLTYLLPQDKK